MDIQQTMKLRKFEGLTMIWKQMKDFPNCNSAFDHIRHFYKSDRSELNVCEPDIRVFTFLNSLLLYRHLLCIHVFDNKIFRTEFLKMRILYIAMGLKNQLFLRCSQDFPEFWEILCQRSRLGAMLCAQSESKWFYSTSESGIHILDGVIYSQTLILTFLNFYPVRSVDPWSEWNDGYYWWSRRWIFICFKT